MTSSSPSNHHLKLLAGADRSSVESLKKQLATSSDVPPPSAQTPREIAPVLPSREQSPSSASKFETWQDLWARDHKPPLTLDTAPVGAVVFHSDVPAIKLILNDGRWAAPEATAATMNKVLVKGNVYTYSVQDRKESELPEDVASGQSWGVIGDKACWGIPYTEGVEAILESIEQHPDIPPWSSTWSLVRTTSLASVIAFGSVTETYDGYQLAAAERSGRDTIVFLAESGGDTEETVVLSYGTKAPSTQVPIALAGRMSK